MLTINVIFHCVSGHSFRLAEAIADGVAEVPRCQAMLLLIAEPNSATPITMPGLEKRHNDFSRIAEASIQDLVDCDGLALGSRIYWGGMSYATKHFLEVPSGFGRCRLLTSPSKLPVSPESRRLRSLREAADLVTIRATSVFGPHWDSSG